MWGYSSAGSPAQSLNHPRKNLILTLFHTWGYSSAGRALEWHSRGQRFDPAYLHQESSGKSEGKGFKSKDLRLFSCFLLQFVQCHIKLFLTCLTKCLTKSGVFKNVPHRLCGCPFALEVNVGINVKRSRYFLMTKILCNLFDRHTIVQQQTPRRVP